MEYSYQLNAKFDAREIATWRQWFIPDEFNEKHLPWLYLGLEL